MKYRYVVNCSKSRITLFFTLFSKTISDWRLDEVMCFPFDQICFHTSRQLQSQNEIFSLVIDETYDKWNPKKGTFWGNKQFLCGHAALVRYLSFSAHVTNWEVICIPKNCFYIQRSPLGLGA